MQLRHCVLRRSPELQAACWLPPRVKQSFNLSPALLMLLLLACCRARAACTLEAPPNSSWSCVLSDATPAFSTTRPSALSGCSWWVARQGGPSWLVTRPPSCRRSWVSNDVGRCTAALERLVLLLGAADVQTRVCTLARSVPTHTSSVRTC